MADVFALSSFSAESTLILARSPNAVALSEPPTQEEPSGFEADVANPVGVAQNPVAAEPAPAPQDDKTVVIDEVDPPEVPTTGTTPANDKTPQANYPG